MLARGVLLILALGVCGWLAVGIHSQRLVDRGIAVLYAARQGEASPDALEEARRRFVDARRFNDDTDVLLREAFSLLILNRETARAAELAREAVRREPSNFMAWSLLNQATSEQDPAAAARARTRVEALDPDLGEGR